MRFEITHRGGQVNGQSLNSTELAIVREHAAEIRDEIMELEARVSSDVIEARKLRELYDHVLYLRRVVADEDRTVQEAAQRAEEARDAKRRSDEKRAVLDRWQARVESDPTAYSIEILPAISFDVDAAANEFFRRLEALPDVMEIDGVHVLVRKRRQEIGFAELIATVLSDMRAASRATSVPSRPQVTANRWPSRFVDGTE